MLDRVLGKLTPDANDPGILHVSIEFDGGKIPLQIDEGESNLETTVQLAREVVANLASLEAQARAIAAQELIHDYNGNWREFRRAREDGTLEDVCNPILSETEFADRLQLYSLSVIGTMLDFSFDDDNLFAGHLVVVTSFDGLAMTDVCATIFG